MLDEETSFLRAIVSSPADPGLRRVYADWLVEHGQTEKAEWVRRDADDLETHGERLREVAPLGTEDPRGPEYLASWTRHPWHAELANRRVVKRLGRAVPRRWRSLLETLGRPPRFNRFIDDRGAPAFEPREFPLAEPFVSRGAVLTFASAFRVLPDDFVGLMDDLKGLAAAGLDDHAGAFRRRLGAAALTPFAVDAPFVGEVERASEVLAALRVAVGVRQRVEIHAWNPGGVWPIVQDPTERVRSEHERMPLRRLAGLMRLVGSPNERHHRGSPVWHGRIPGRARSEVSLWFAAARSLRGDRLLGLLTHDRDWDRRLRADSVGGA